MITTNKIRPWLATFILLLSAFGLYFTGCSSTQPEPLLSDAVWKGNAIAYSGYREGQSPQTEIYPTRSEILEDLRILERNWQLIRLYGADEFSQRVLEAIRSENIKLKVMLGAWLGDESKTRVENEQQVAAAIQLAKEYPELIIAINVGNETLVDWSFHPVPEERVIEYVRQVKAAVDVPVTVADNYAYWRDHGQNLAREVDFVTVHTYPLWERRSIDQGLSYTIQNLTEVRQALPAGKPIIIGEAGWATYTVGDLHVPRSGNEANQQRYFKELTEWCRKQGIPLFWFEAFDEPWKGTGTEGYWGLFTVDRKAKPAVANLYPELTTDKPTSPSYDDQEAAENGVELATMLKTASLELSGFARVIPLAPWPGLVEISAVDRPGTVDQYLLFKHHGGDWGGFYFILESPTDISNYTHLELSAKIPDNITSLEIKLEAPREKPVVLNLVDYTSDFLTDDWYQVSIPLQDFSGLDLTHLEVIGFWNPSDAAGNFIETAILLDNLQFVAK